MRLPTSFKSDLLSSLVVFVVAIPLSLGIALASGTSPTSGLIAAAVGGIIVGLLSGAPLMVSGPAAGLTVLVFQIVQELGISGLAAATIMAGAFQLLLSLCRCGWVFNLVPKSILSGMLGAIGLIILLGQMHVLAGQPVPDSPIGALLGLPQSIGAALGFDQSMIGLAPVFAVGLLAVFIQIALPKIQKLKRIPAALPAVGIATLVGLAWDIPRVEVASLLSGMGTGTRGLASVGLTPEILPIVVAAIGLALVASAESLLTARAIDILKKEKRAEETEKTSDLNRELFAQGLGNAISGFFGGLPITGVIVRSAANLDAGAKTRLSAVLHGLWVVLFVMLFPAVLTKIPLAALAAVLVVTGVKLLAIPQWLATLKSEPVSFGLWTLTVVFIVSTNLLTGLALALCTAVLIYSPAIVRKFTMREVNAE